MKKIYVVMVAAMATLMVSCQHEKQTTPSTQEFPYMVDQFYDLGILRYRVPGFEDLTLQQKCLVYYLNEAALWGRDILWDQNCKYNLRVRRACEKIYLSYQGDRTDAEFLLFEQYLKRLWFSNGIHHHYSEDKFVPECSQEWLYEQADAAGIADLDELLLVIYDPTLLAKKVNQESGKDLLLTSACNYYEGVSQKEAEDYYEVNKDTSDEPRWVGLNSKLVKENGVVVEKTFRVGGMYSAALEKVVENLRLALNYVENDQQRLVLEKLIAYNETGDLTTFNEYAIAWVKDLDSRVDFVNGFTEVYGDPLGITGAWEAMVNFKNMEATKRTQLLSDNAQWFEDHSTTAPEYKKKECKGVSAKVITAAILGGDCYPSTPITTE